MKLYKSDITYILLCLTVIFNIGIMRVVGGEFFGKSYPFRYLTIAITILMLAIVLSRTDKYWTTVIISIAFLMSVELIISTFTYNERFLKIFRQNIHVWYYLILIPLLSIGNHVQMKKILKFITYLVLLTLLLKTFSWYISNFKNRIIFENFVYEFGDDWTRNGLYRFNSTPFGSLVFTIISYNLITGKDRYKFIWSVILIYILWYNAVIYQSRAELLICLIPTVFMYLMFKRKQANIFALKYLVLILGIVFIITSGIFKRFIDTFSLGSSMGGSTRLRIEAFQYYLSYFKNNIITGIGFLDNSNAVTLAILRGPSGNRYLDDLGIIGFIFQFGLLGLIILVFIYRRIICIFLSVKDNDKKTLLCGLIILFTCMNFMSACPFDGNRMIIVPFMLAIFEYIYKQR